MTSRNELSLSRKNGPRKNWRNSVSNSEERLMADQQELRMHAYYYGFTPTGVEEIDRILSAVACAGKSFHNTSEWGEKVSAWPPHEGDCPVDWIQNAANRAANLLTRA